MLLWSCFRIGDKKISKKIVIITSIILLAIPACIFPEKNVIFGIFGGGFLGLINILAIFLTTKNLKLQTYFIRTIVKFAVILVLFFTLLKLKANPIAILGGFAVPMFIMSVEVLRCRLLKKQ